MKELLKIILEKIPPLVLLEAFFIMSGFALAAALLFSGHDASGNKLMDMMLGSALTWMKGQMQ